MKGKKFVAKKADKPKVETKNPPSKPFIVGLGVFNKKKPSPEPSSEPSSAPPPKVVTSEEPKNNDQQPKKKEEKKTQENKAPYKYVDKYDKESKKAKNEKAPLKKLKWYEESVDEESEELLVSPEQKWYQQYPAFLDDIKRDQTNVVDEKLSSDIYAAMSRIYTKEVAKYQKVMAKHGLTSEKTWLNSVVTSGTWSDKIAALTLRIQESPFHNLEAFDLLLGIAIRKDLRIALSATEALKDLCINNVLPNRPLFEWKGQPLLHTGMTLSAGLIMWYEKELKSRMIQLIDVLDKCLKSTLTHFRKEALELTVELLKRKPEQETRLLTILVNKFGDSEGIVHSKLSSLLKSLLNKHPAMKLVVIREVRNFIYRPNTKIMAIFHAIMFLVKIPLLENDESSSTVALSLCECYLSLFEKAITIDTNHTNSTTTTSNSNKKKKKSNNKHQNDQVKKDVEIKAKEGSRLLSALLQGINKTFPLIEDVTSLHQYMDAIFRLVHTASSYATATQALLLLSHMVLPATSASAPSDHRHHHHTNDSNHESTKELQTRYFNTLYSKLSSEQVMHRTNNTLFLNILFRSLKYDTVLPRLMSFVKRIAMNALHTSPPVSAGLLFMISELLQIHPSLRIMISSMEQTVHSKEKNALIPPSTVVSISQKKKENEEGESVAESEDQQYLIGNYDMNKRNPEYAIPYSNPDQMEVYPPVLHELYLLKQHVHPSVRAFACALLQPPEYGILFNGDPLVEFNLMSFLNRFAYKHPKKQVTEALQQQQHRRITTATDEHPINEQYASQGMKDIAKIAPEKHFFYKFFSDRDRLRALGKSKPRKTKHENSDDEEGDSDGDSDEDELDAFTEKLANDMMRHDEATRDYGDNDDEDDEFDEDMMDDDDDSEIVMNADEGLDDEEDEEEDEEEEEEVVVKGKKGKQAKPTAIVTTTANKKRKVQELESDALDLDAFKQELSKNTTAANKKANKKASKVADEEGDNVAMPQVYHSSDDENDAQMEDDDDDEDLEGLEGFDDYEDVDFEDDEDDFEEEEEDEVVPVSKKNANKKQDTKTKKGKGKQAKEIMEEYSDDEEDDYEDEDELLPVKATGNKGKGKGKDIKKKTKKVNFGDDFADASLFEDQMEENVKAYQLESIMKEIKDYEAQEKLEKVNNSNNNNNNKKGTTAAPASNNKYDSKKDNKKENNNSNQYQNKNQNNKNSSNNNNKNNKNSYSNKKAKFNKK